MGRRVVVIASGETERRAVPLLLAHLGAEGIEVIGVRIPPGHSRLDVKMAERLVKAAWFGFPSTERPDKFVVLLDTDGRSEDSVLRPFRTQLGQRLGVIRAALRFACAQWHLESWFFADSSGLRACLGRDLGNCDPSQPDSIHNPKLHLRQLLGDRVYTAELSGTIAASLNPGEIARHSPSYRGFLDAVRNGGSGAEARRAG